MTLRSLRCPRQSWRTDDARARQGSAAPPVRLPCHASYAPDISWGGCCPAACNSQLAGVYHPCAKPLFSYPMAKALQADVTYVAGT